MLPFQLSNLRKTHIFHPTMPPLGIVFCEQALAADWGISGYQNAQQSNNQQSRKNNVGGRDKGKRASLKKAKKDFEFDSLPYQMLFTMSICTKANNIDDILTGPKFDLQSTEGVFVRLKGVQCRKSMPKYMLTCVNSNLWSLPTRCACACHSGMLSSQGTMEAVQVRETLLDWVLRQAPPASK